MRLVFIHGWGFDARFWDDLSARLPEIPQARAELGFLGQDVQEPDVGEEDILVGHSLGFLWGLTRRAWRGWVAINAFARFVKKPDGEGCVDAATLLAMRRKLSVNPAQTLADFYSAIAASPPEGSPHVERLCNGLDILRDEDGTEILKNNGTPALVLATRDDPLVPVAATEFLAKSPCCDARWREDGGHLLPLREPEWCASAILDFVNTRC